MLSALSRRSLLHRLRQAYVVRSIASNQQHQPKKQRLHILCDKKFPSHSYDTATVFDSFARLMSIATMSSTTSTINLQTLGNNFVKTVPTMEVMLSSFYQQIHNHKRKFVNFYRKWN